MAAGELEKEREDMAAGGPGKAREVKEGHACHSCMRWPSHMAPAFYPQHPGRSTQTPGLQ